jgi:ATP-dependent DNA helicase RecQ
VISDEEWAGAKAIWQETFRESNKREVCLAMMEDFERVNPRRKYKSDWKTFLDESKFEDFLRIKSDVIYVSTIHKAKGKEFDNVFLVLDGFEIKEAESKRQLYVAITRAKSHLSIHYNGNYLQGFVTNNLTYTADRAAYAPPAYLSCVLTHKDVQLGYFTYVQRRMNGLQSGQTLAISEEGLCNHYGELVLKFSKSFQSLLNSHKANGYNLSCSNINYFVYWKDGDMEREVEIILPELELFKVVK